MVNKLTELFKKGRHHVDNEEGAQAIEYVAVGALVVALLGIIIQAVSGGGIGETVVSTIEGFFESWG